MQFGIPTTGTGIVKSTNGILDSAVSKVTITEPATAATLTIINNKTLTINNTLAFSGTDETTITTPSTNSTMARTDASQTFVGTQTVNGGIIILEGYPLLLRGPSNAIYFGAGDDTRIARGSSAGMFVFGLPDGASPGSQTISFRSVVAGTSNTVGGTTTLEASRSTGSATGGSFVFKTSPAGSSGTAQNTLVTSFTINGDGSTTHSMVSVLKNYTVATLPAAASYTYGRAFVSDALTPTFGSAVVAGGAVTVPVYSDGSNWIVG